MKIMILLTSLFLIGCSTVPEVKTVAIKELEKQGTHQIASTQETQYRSCDFETWNVKEGGNTYNASPLLRRPGSSSMFALPAEHIRVARLAFVYAIMASKV